MPDPTEELFNRLGNRGHDPLLEQIRGTVRFDLATDADTLYWLIEIDRGDVRISREQRDADCVINSTKARFDQIAAGRANAVAMMLRTDIVVHGDVQLLIVLERILPGPPGARGPRHSVVTESARR
jgi:predicted lipid carrier protein YhbT